MDVLDLERWVRERGWKRATANKFTKAVKLFNNISNDSEQTTASRPSQPTTASRPSQPKTSSHDDVKKEDDPELKLWFKQTLKLPQYHSSFIAYGIEKVEHLKLNVTDQDLIDMGIRAPMHRSRILKAIEDILDEEPDEMKLWFKNMKLQRYYQWFIDAGYGHLSSLNESVQDADLQKLGIKQERHRIKILKAIKEKEQRQKEEKRRKEAEQKRLEEQRRKEEEQKRESHHDDTVKPQPTLVQNEEECVEVGAQLDGTAPIRDDELRTILEPHDGLVDLLEYLDPLRAAGFTNNTKLRTLTRETIKR
eukprot:514631_1